MSELLEMMVGSELASERRWFRSFMGDIPAEKLDELAVLHVFGRSRTRARERRVRHLVGHRSSTRRPRAPRSRTSRSSRRSARRVRARRASAPEPPPSPDGPGAAPGGPPPKLARVERWAAGGSARSAGFAPGQQAPSSERGGGDASAQRAASSAHSTEAL